MTSDTVIGFIGAALLWLVVDGGIALTRLWVRSEGLGRTAVRLDDCLTRIGRAWSAWWGTNKELIGAIALILGWHIFWGILVVEGFSHRASPGDKSGWILGCIALIPIIGVNVLIVRALIGDMADAHRRRQKGIRKLEE
jgi:hypothetical protein